MESQKLSFILLALLGLLCVANSNPLTGLFGKSEDKAEDEKPEAAAKAAEVTTTTTTTTTTPEPSSACGGLKGFLHICDKPEPTEPPKSVKTRSVDDESEESDESDSDEEEKKESDLEKRQVGDPEAPVLGEIPPMVGDAMVPPVEPEEKTLKKRQSEDSDENEEDEESRKRRDCRDREGDYEKDCRKKRELVPTCTEPNCGKPEPKSEP